MEACVVRILGSQSPEKVYGGQMQIVERVLAGTYFAWGQMFLTCVQRQLTATKEAGKGFCFGSFLVAFFMERVPTLWPRVPVREGGLREPQMIRWGEMMRRHGGGDVGRYFTRELYMQWLQLPRRWRIIPTEIWTSQGIQMRHGHQDRHGVQMVCMI